MKRTTDIFRGQIIDVGPCTHIIQLTGPIDKLDSFLAGFGEAEVLEVVRSGVAGMARGEKVCLSSCRHLASASINDGCATPINAQ